MNGLRARYVAIGFLVVALVLSFVVSREGMDPGDAFNRGLTGALGIIGATLAAVAAIELCFLAIQGASAASLPVVVAVLLGGLALITGGWPVLLGLAAVTVAAVLQPALGGSGGDKAARAVRKKA